MNADDIASEIKALPVPIRLLILPFFLIGFAFFAAICLFEYIVMGFIFIGSGLLLSLVLSSNPYLQVIGITAGSLCTVCCFAAGYIKSGFHLQPKGLKILDWMLIVMNLVMMGCFQWIGADPIYWVIFVFVPAIVVRSVISAIVNNKKRSPD